MGELGEEFEAYVTKWALSVGVRKMRGREWVSESGTRYFLPAGVRGHLISPNHWFRDEAGAIHAVGLMLARREKALAKEQKKLDAMAKELAAGRLPMAKEGR